MRAGIEQGPLLALLLCCSSCGGNVDLGGRDQDPPPIVDEPDGVLPDDPHLVKSERTLELGDVRASGPIAVAGDDLYLAGYDRDGSGSGLFRCKKSRCQSTFQRLPGVNDVISVLQQDGDRLAIVGNEPDRWIGSYALPDVNDRQVVLESLPSYEQFAALFHGGFAFWPMRMDRAYYRCAMPKCAGGPRKLLDVDLAGRAAGDGDLVFINVRGQIVRMARLGDGTIEHLLPDDTLSPAPPLPEDGSEEEVPEYAQLVAVSAGRLYASVQPEGCSKCPWLIASWPVGGGPREELLRVEGQIVDLLVLGQELAWVIRREGSEIGELATCRVEACSDTLRRLGPIDGTPPGMAGDDERIYWVEKERVRSVARLPPD